MAKTNKNGPIHLTLNTRCWVWTGYRTKFGYGGICINYRRMGTHVLSYNLFVGPVPNGMCVLHKCDNPACVNPGHLFVGTLADNVRDCKDKNRIATGELHGRAKLNETQVKEIRSRFKYGSRIDGAEALARELGIDATQVRRIVRREHWTCIK